MVADLNVACQDAITQFTDAWLREGTASLGPWRGPARGVWASDSNEDIFVAREGSHRRGYGRHDRRS